MSTVTLEPIVETTAPPGTVDPISEALEKAADFLEKYGWNQGAGHQNPWNLYSPSCTLGALYVVTGGMLDKDRSYVHSRLGFHVESARRFRDFLGLQAWGDNENASILNPVASWNDNPERTKEEVIRALREASAWVEPSHT